LGGFWGSAQKITPEGEWPGDNRRKPKKHCQTKPRRVWGKRKRGKKGETHFEGGTLDGPKK